MTQIAAELFPFKEPRALAGFAAEPAGGVERDSSGGSSTSSIGAGLPARPRMSQVGRSHSTSGKSRWYLR